jgi:hypothetical protein
MEIVRWFIGYFIAEKFIERGKKMIQLNPRFLEKDGKKEFVVLPYEEFEQVLEELSDYQDLKDLRAAQAEEETSPGLSLAEVRKKLTV